jgi:predicted metal-dependent enzyme (double-stranded beta helix superfamily)
MSRTATSTGLAELIQRLDAAVAQRDDEVRCQNVKRVLSEAVASNSEFLDFPFLQPAGDRYARRLVHRDPAGRYTVLAMVWDRGQGTALHDHGGMWCVECVYQGRIRVTSYAVRGGDPETGVVQFSREREVTAGPAEAGALIPPFEYHMLANADETPAVTIHVYGGEMTSCHIYEPVEGGWRRRFKTLEYTA